MIELARFSDSPLRRALEKETKTTENQIIKQAQLLKV